MNKIPEKLISLFKDIGITSDQALWDCHGTPVVNHKSLERVAHHLDICFDQPQIIESNATTKTVVMVVTGRLATEEGEKIEWSFGEAAPYNNKNGYPFAMAEKRAKDRVILKLIEISGDVYSNEEAEDFKAEIARQNRENNAAEAPQDTSVTVYPTAPPPPPPPSAEPPISDGDMWRQWVDEQKLKLDGFTKRWECTKWGTHTITERKNLKTYSAELIEELKSYYEDIYNNINEA
tara:strand:- start:3147 stop:3851 length:705 start_codon:yes stop_codon:yes gene_type:complete